MASNNSPQQAGDPLVAPATPAGWLARNLTTLVLVALGAAVAGMLLRGSTDPLDDIFSLFKMVVGLGFVIFIHELGHFAAAKLCDVHVQTFSIGFGPPFLGICSVKWGETTYKIGWIPLGGFVKMVGEGEGEESEEQTEDPRSYKNKKVWQRMIIISAGVTMNVLLAMVCYMALFSTRGEERAVGVAGTAAPGGPAWKKGLQSGAYIHRIGKRDHPFYDDLQREVFRAGKDNALPIVFDTYGADGGVRHHDTTIMPIRNSEILAPMLLVYSGNIPVLARKTGDSKEPFIPNSPAAKASPPFQSGDRVIAATDPDDPAKITPLRPNPHHPEAGLDYYDLKRRMQRLAGKPITLRVQHDESGTTDDITVQSAFAKSLGLRMQMGQIVALQEGSSAAEKELRPGDGKTEGDIIEAIEVTSADGQKLRYSVDPKAGEQPLDPVRLPTQLALWAESKPKSYTVKLTVSRRDGHGRKSQDVDLTWDRNVMPLDTPPSAWPIIELPLSISALGIAYKVQSTVDGIEPGSPAASTSIKRGDVITAISFKTELGGKERTETVPIKEDEWAYVGSSLAESTQLTEVELSIKDGEKVKLTPKVDETWPLPERGLMFDADKRTVKAEGVADALNMASRRALRESTRIYENLAGVFRGRLSVRAFGGPLTIGKRAFDLAGHDMYEFIIFIALININLAVVNFLPIPVLDGGHMVFLIYEGLRGKPPSDRWRYILTIMGLIVVLGLMALTLGLDFDRYILPWLKRQVGM